MRRLMILLLVAASWASADTSQSCTEDPSQAETPGAQGCKYAVTYRYFDNLLKDKHTELIGYLSNSDNYPYANYTQDRLIQALEKQHLLLRNYIIEECEIIGSIHGGGGLWPTVHSNKCAATLTEKRFRSVAAALNCIKNASFESRSISQSQCLYQLAPLSLRK